MNELMNHFEQKIKKATDDTLNEVISRGALKLDDDKIRTVSFCFWLCYMAETELHKILIESWSVACKPFDNKTKKVATEKLNNMIKGKKMLDVENLEYFIDKIKIYQAMLGDDNLAKILFKINDIRNDLSHNRIDDLKYDEQSLFLRSTKEKILLDYFSASMSNDLSKSKSWNQLSEEEKKDLLNLASS